MKKEITKEDVLINIEALIDDAELGINYTKKGITIPWDVDGWEAILESILEIKSYIERE